MESEKQYPVIVASDLVRALLVGTLLELLFIAASFSVQANPSERGIPHAQAWLSITQQPAAGVLARELRGWRLLPAVVLLGLTQVIAYSAIALGVLYWVRLLKSTRFGNVAGLHRDVKTALAVGYGIELLLAIRVLAYYNAIASAQNWIEATQMPGSLVTEMLLGSVESYFAVGCTVLIQGAIFSLLFLAAIYAFRILRGPHYGFPAPLMKT
jgi:hypothetical protein